VLLFEALLFRALLFRALLFAQFGALLFRVLLFRVLFWVLSSGVVIKIKATWQLIIILFAAIKQSVL